MKSSILKYSSSILQINKMIDETKYVFTNFWSKYKLVFLVVMINNNFVYFQVQLIKMISNYYKINSKTKNKI